MFVLAVTSRSGTTVTPLRSAASALPAANAKRNEPATAACCFLENFPFIICLRCPSRGRVRSPAYDLARVQHLISTCVAQGAKYGMWRCTPDLQIQKKLHRTI